MRNEVTSHTSRQIALSSKHDNQVNPKLPDITVNCLVAHYNVYSLATTLYTLKIHPVVSPHPAAVNDSPWVDHPLLMPKLTLLFTQPVSQHYILLSFAHSQLSAQHQNLAVV